MTDNPRAGYVRYTRINLCVGSNESRKKPPVAIRLRNPLSVIPTSIGV
jgi:hypothetical protein